jgi:hypothetical protein
MEGRIFVGDKRVCEAIVSCRLVPRAAGAAEAQNAE